MALVNCPECSKEISADASKCLSCGKSNSTTQCKQTLDVSHINYYEYVGEFKYQAYFM
jgi:hypothetical protein